MKLHALPNKMVLRFKGRACEFLNAYATNVVTASRSAFVNLKGQIVCTFDQMVISAEKMMVVIESAYVDRLKKHLEKSLPLYGTVIETAAEYRLYFDLDDAREPQRGEIFVPQKKGKLIGVTAELEAGVSEEEFRWFRVQQALPVQGVDYDEEMLLNVGDEEFISTTKGCYLGQEIIARVHHRGKPPKKLVVRSEEDCTDEEKARLTSKVRDPQTGRILGFLFIDN